MKLYDIAFLHTANIHVKTFNRLVMKMDSTINVQHLVDEGLLKSACREGITPDLEKRIEAAMLKGTFEGARLVVCTCSTIGGVAEQTGPRHHFKSMRIDRAMANEAVNTGEKLLVLAALESTLKPTVELIKNSADRNNKTPMIEVKHIGNIWRYFESNELEQFYQRIATAIMQYEKDYDVIVLAQASMSNAIGYCENIETPVLSSPRTGIEAALNELMQCSKPE